MAAVGFVGLGAIGRPMAERLVDWPEGLWVCDIDPRATAALEASGAKVAATPEELSERVGHVSVMVRDDAQVRVVLSGPDGILAGAARGCVVAVHSTVHPDTVPELVSPAAQRGVRVLDAPVSGGTVEAGDRLGVELPLTRLALDRFAVALGFAGRADR